MSLAVGNVQPLSFHLRYGQHYIVAGFGKPLQNSEMLQSLISLPFGFLRLQAFPSSFVLNDPRPEHIKLMIKTIQIFQNERGKTISKLV